MKTLAQARIEVENLPSHDIGGYDWECYSCHAHFIGKHCSICNLTPTTKDYSDYDEKGNKCDHMDLIDRNLVLKLLGVENEEI